MNGEFRFDQNVLAEDQRLFHLNVLLGDDPRNGDGLHVRERPLLGALLQLLIPPKVRPLAVL